MFTRVTSLGSGGQVSARGDVIALTQPNGDQASLLVGVGGALPTAVPDVGSLPSWAHPHVGTDRQGRPVVIYPRCSSAKVASCDLWVYRVQSRRTSRLADVNARTVGETEGAMDRGALAYTRWTAQEEPAVGNGVTPTTVRYKPTDGTARVVTRRGGQQLALSGRRIAQARLVDPGVGECGLRSVEIVTTTGHRRTVRSYRCGLDAHTPLGLGFVRGRLLWAMHALGQGHYAQYVVATGQTFYEDTSTEFLTAYAPVTTRSGLIVQWGEPPLSVGDWRLERISGLTYPRGREG